MRYLDPRNDLTFKKVFGEHPDLLISFLNALMPFDDKSEHIKQIEYLPNELVPDTPFRKDSIVDVRCIDSTGRQFIVEMQMYWDDDFLQRVTFNASKAYVRQIERGRSFSQLEPVYTLSLLNENFRLDGKDADKCYHHYSIVDVEDTDEMIPGMEFIFVELQKFKPKNFSQKKMVVLWLRYLTEIKDKTRDSEIAQELKGNKYIRKALDILEESSYSNEEMIAYDDNWDRIMTYKTLVEAKERRAMKTGEKIGIEKGEKIGIEKGEKIGIEKGEKIGIEKGEKIGIEKGEQKKALDIARTMKENGFDSPTIAKMTGLTEQQINDL